MKKKTLIVAIIVVFGLTISNHADIVIKSTTNVNMMGMGQMTISGTQFFKGDRSCHRTKMESGSQMMNMPMETSENIEIIRLDKGVQWTVSPAAKSYREINFEDMKKIVADMEQTGEKLPDKYNWTTTFDDGKLEEIINGIECHGAKGQSIGIGKEDNSDTVFINYHQWFSLDMSGSDEFKSYNEKYAEITGFDNEVMSQIASNPALASYGDPLKELAEKIKQMDGVPIKTFFSIEGVKKPLGARMGENDMNEEDLAVIKKLGLSIPGKSESSGGRFVIISLDSEVTSISDKVVDDSQFEIPEGYTRQ
jgi:hypothetical protein